VPQAESQAARKPGPAVPAAKTERKPPAAAGPRTRTKKVKEDQPDPLDTRQQGSLF
jgi:hypothetical protein